MGRVFLTSQGLYSIPFWTYFDRMGRFNSIPMHRKFFDLVRVLSIIEEMRAGELISYDPRSPVIKYGIWEWSISCLSSCQTKRLRKRYRSLSSAILCVT